MKKNQLLITASIVALITLSACGDNNDSSEQSNTEPTSTTEKETKTNPASDQGSNSGNKPETSKDEEDETDLDITFDMDELFQDYEESKSLSDYTLAQKQDIIYLGMDYISYTDETMFEFMIAEGYYDEVNDRAFDVWIAQDGFLGVEFTPDDGLLDIREFNTMEEAHKYAEDNYGAL